MPHDKPYAPSELRGAGSKKPRRGKTEKVGKARKTRRPRKATTLDRSYGPF